MKEFDVIGIGNPLVDVLVKVDESHVAELDLKLGQFNLVDEDRLKFVMQSVMKKSPQIAPGDSTANTIAGVANLGGKVMYIGKIGQDDDGAYYEETLVEGKVVSRMASCNEPTGKVIVLVNSNGNRTFAVNLGASLKLEADDVLENDIKNAKILHLTGYQLEDLGLRKTALHAMDIAKKNGVMISIDLADPGVVLRNLKELREIVKTYASIVFANEEEAKAFTGHGPHDALLNISNYVETVCVKIGAEGSLIMHKGKLIKVLGVKVNAVDTTGAGDMYAAGILFGLTHGIELEKAGKIASFAAACVVEQMGARLKHSIIDKIEML